MGTSGTSGFSGIAAVTLEYENFVIEGGGATIPLGLKGYIRIGYDAEILEVSLAAMSAGNLVIDIWKNNFAGFPPTSLNSICNSTKPTLSMAQKSTDTVLAGWTTTINEGDFLAISVDSCSYITNATLSLQFRRL